VRFYDSNPREVHTVRSWVNMTLVNELYIFCFTEVWGWLLEGGLQEGGAYEIFGLQGGGGLLEGELKEGDLNRRFTVIPPARQNKFTSENFIQI